MMATSSSSTEPRSPVGNRTTMVNHRNVASPRTGAVSAPVNHDSASYLSPTRSGLSSPPSQQRHSIVFPTHQRSLLSGQLSSSQSLTVTSSSPRTSSRLLPPLHVPYKLSTNSSSSPGSPYYTGRKVVSVASASLAKSRARSAQKENDAMVYLDGPQIYTCAQCRTHLTSHDDIISKSFHGRHGRAYLFDQCVNVTIGKAEDRVLITGLHSVCDIFCKRCKNMVGWTYSRAYETSQKYKEGKYIIEKVNLHMEESPNYDIIPPPAGERPDRWRRRSMSWGTESCSTTTTSSTTHLLLSSSPAGSSVSSSENMVYEYRPPSPESDGM